MTRKDYILIASALRRADVKVSGLLAFDDYTPEQVLRVHSEILIALLGQDLAEDNSRFDRERFTDAARVGEVAR